MRISVMSFGFKHGVPLDADLVFDCRFLPNPHWVDELRPLSGLDAPVRDFVWARRPPSPSSTGSTTWSGLLLPAYVEEGKSYLTIALGCTGGRHRSVALAEELARRLRRPGRLARSSSTGTSTGDAKCGPGPRVVAVGGGHGLAATLRAAAPLRRRDHGRGLGGRRRRVVGAAAAPARHRAPRGPAQVPGGPGRGRTRPWPRAFEQRFEAEELVGPRPRQPGHRRADGGRRATSRRAWTRRLGCSGPRDGSCRPPPSRSCSRPRPRRGRSRARPPSCGPPTSSGSRSSRPTVRPPPVALHALAAGRPGRHRPGLAVHERAGRGGRAGHGRGHPALAGAPGLRRQPASPAGRDGRLRRGRPRRRPGRARGRGRHGAGRPGRASTSGRLDVAVVEVPAGQSERSGPRSRQDWRPPSAVWSDRTAMR